MRRAARSAAKRTRFKGDDIMTVANVFFAFLVVAILSVWPLTKWAIRSLKELEDEAKIELSRGDKAAGIFCGLVVIIVLFAALFDPAKDLIVGWAW